MKIIPRFSLVFSLLVAVVATQETPAATKKVFVFRGIIQAVNTTVRTFTLRGEKQTYVFIVTDQTKIVLDGAAQKFTDQVMRNQCAEVDTKVGPDGKGVALSVKLTSCSDVAERALLAATSPSGKTLSAQEVKPLILYKPAVRTLMFHASFVHRIGVFLLSVRSDGTVSNVEILQSIGASRFDAEWVKTLMKWRFRPNSVKQVRVPGDYRRSY
jgi:TonB family protein